MSKRTNETGQMRREDYEYNAERTDDSDTVSKEFQKADEETLKTRRMVSVSYRFKKEGTTVVPIAAPAPAPLPASQNTNPFSGFTGLTNAPPSNPFAGFTGLTGGTSSSQNTHPKAPAPGKNYESSNEGFKSAMTNLNKSFSGFVKRQMDENPTCSWVEAANDYLQHVKMLEKKYNIEPGKDEAEAQPMLKTPSENGTGESSKPKPDNNKQPAEKAALPASFLPNSPAISIGASGFSFGATNPSAASEATSTGAKGFSAGAANPLASSGAISTPGFSFGATNPSASSGATSTGAPGFSFGAANPLASSGSSGFSFGSANPGMSSPINSAPGPATAFGGFGFGASLGQANAAPANAFSFGSTPGTAAISASGADDEDGEDAMPPEEPTVVERNAEEEATESIEFDDRSKLYQFDKENSCWKDMGVGNLRLMRHKETKKSRILIRNSAGKVTLNTIISSAVKFDFDTKKGTMGFIAADQSGNITKFQIKVVKDIFPKLNSEVLRLQKEA